MRRAASIALLSLVVVALVGAPAAARDRRPDRPAPDPVVTAFAGRARQGGTLLVGVIVSLPRGAHLAGVPSATAVVHFASDDVAVDLVGHTPRHGHRHHGHGPRGWWGPPVPVWWGVARVPVGATETPGLVQVDVTVALGDHSVIASTVGRIRPARWTTPPSDPGQPDPGQPDPGQPCTDGCQES
jgi:hypothetical protein